MRQTKNELVCANKVSEGLAQRQTETDSLRLMALSCQLLHSCPCIPIYSGYLLCAVGTHSVTQGRERWVRQDPWEHPCDDTPGSFWAQKEITSTPKDASCLKITLTPLPISNHSRQTSRASFWKWYTVNPGHRTAQLMLARETQGKHLAWQGQDVLGRSGNQTTTFRRGIALQGKCMALSSC